MPTKGITLCTKTLGNQHCGRLDIDGDGTSQIDTGIGF